MATDLNLTKEFHDRIVNEICDRLNQVMYGREDLNIHNLENRIPPPSPEDVLVAKARIAAYRNANSDVERVRKEYLEAPLRGSLDHGH